MLALLPAVSAAPLPPPVLEFLDRNCLGCHDAVERKGGVDLESLAANNDEAAHAKWVRAFDLVTAGEMPPKNKPRPDEAEQKQFLDTLGLRLTEEHAARKGTVLRRLNRTEYENTLRELLGIHVDLRPLLPEDTLAHGFDNIGDALGMSDVQLRHYLEAARFALDELFARTARPDTVRKSYRLKDPARITPPGPAPKGSGANDLLVRPDGSAVSFGNGRFPRLAPSVFEGDPRGTEFRAPAEGRYRIVVRGYAYQSAEPVLVALRTGLFNVIGDLGTVAALGEFGPTPSGWETTALLRSGERVRLYPELNLDYAMINRLGPTGYTGPGLGVSEIEIEGPLTAAWPLRGHTLLMGDLLASAKTVRTERRRPSLALQSSRPEADAARLLARFAEAAFRRPLAAGAIDPYLDLFRTVHARSSDFTAALKAAAAGILCAPEFLYLVEPAGKLDDYTLASRLAYFLTRAAPDAQLLREAAAGRLHRPDVLRSETERLLNHPGAARFHADFTDAWLNLRDIDFTAPDDKLYPEFDEVLKASMVAETRTYFAELLRSDAPASTIVASDFALLNRRLARHYALPEVAGMELRRVPLAADSRRGGFLTQASVLKVSANGTNTSPVVRGAYVLDRILGQPPSPPPPGTPGVEPDVRGAKTLRELLDRHRTLESCNSCHRRIDPPGFALENYDPIGGWRDSFRSLVAGAKVEGKIGGRPIRYKTNLPVDASGELPDGTRFANFAEFQRHLAAADPQLRRAFAERLLTFAVGRELGFSDRPELDRLVALPGGLRALLHAAVQSDIFRHK